MKGWVEVESVQEQQFMWSSEKLAGVLLGEAILSDDEVVRTIRERKKGDPEYGQLADFAKACMQGLLSDPIRLRARLPTLEETYADVAVRYAKALVKRLEKEKG